MSPKCIALRKSTLTENIMMSGLAFHPDGVKFNPDIDIPDLSGKVILVTGGESSPSMKSVVSHSTQVLLALVRLR